MHCSNQPNKCTAVEKGIYVPKIISNSCLYVYFAGSLSWWQDSLAVWEMRALRGLETARVLPGLRPVTLPPQLLSSQCCPGRWSCALTSAKATAKQQHLTTLGRALSQHRAVYTAHTWSPVIRGLHVTSQRWWATYHGGGETSDHLHCWNKDRTLAGIHVVTKHDEWFQRSLSLL